MRYIQIDTEVEVDVYDIIESMTGPELLEFRGLIDEEIRGYNIESNSQSSAVIVMPHIGHSSEPSTFINACSKLVENKWRLSVEDEHAILKIANKL